MTKYATADEIRELRTELTRLRAENQQLTEWRQSVSSAIQLIPEFQTGHWGGDKSGWGWHFEMVNYCRRQRETAEQRLAQIRELLL